MKVIYLWLYVRKLLLTYFPFEYEHFFVVSFNLVDLQAHIRSFSVISPVLALTSQAWKTVENHNFTFSLLFFSKIHFGTTHHITKIWKLYDSPLVSTRLLGSVLGRSFRVKYFLWFSLITSIWLYLFRSNDVTICHKAKNNSIIRIKNLFLPTTVILSHRIRLRELLWSNFVLLVDTKMLSLFTNDCFKFSRLQKRSDEFSEKEDLSHSGDERRTESPASLPPDNEENASETNLPHLVEAEAVIKHLEERRQSSLDQHWAIPNKIRSLENECPAADDGNYTLSSLTWVCNLLEPKYCV